MKIVPLILFCIACFLAGIFIQWNFIDPPVTTLFVPDNPIVSAEVTIETKIAPELAAPVALQTLIEEKLAPSIDTDHPENLDSVYKQTKKNIIETYNSGHRDEKTVQSFLYIASLENNQKDYKNAAKEWCQKKHDECVRSQMPIFVSGTVVDEA